MKTVRILVVDDEEGYRILLPRLLEPIGTTFLTASTLQEAKEIMAQQPPPDFIFLDLKLPDSPQATMTLAAVPELRGFNPEAPLVVLTGDPDEKIAQVAKAMGVDAYRTKMDMEAQKYLFEAMDEALREHERKGMSRSEAWEMIYKKVNSLLYPAEAA